MKPSDTPETDAVVHEIEVMHGPQVTWAFKKLNDHAHKLELERDQLRARAAELERWKAEALHVESQWDVQKVGSLIGAPLGYLIQPFIQPKIEELLRRIDELEKDKE